ncbi:phiSA1p31-related protein [Streptomyces sp. NPDC091412]|uniref:phiSA1p31-related protein n=1 Tax=Streptomyces sp. NPDC091412 TaxID=3366002 RepID=UPI0038238092
MTSLLDGHVIDLDRMQVAVDGSRWLWTCDVSESGQPLMQRLDGHGTVLTLPEVYGQHGPLTAAPQPVTAAMCRQVLLYGATA